MNLMFVLHYLGMKRMAARWASAVKRRRERHLQWTPDWLHFMAQDYYLANKPVFCTCCTRVLPCDTRLVGLHNSCAQTMLLRAFERCTPEAQAELYRASSNTPSLMAALDATYPQAAKQA